MPKAYSTRKPTYPVPTLRGVRVFLIIIMHLQTSSKYWQILKSLKYDGSDVGVIEKNDHLTSNKLSLDQAK